MKGGRLMVHEPREELIDIRSVTVNKDLSKDERIKEYMRQIKNPYRFRCGDYVINASFSSDGVTIEERLQALFR